MTGAHLALLGIAVAAYALFGRIGLAPQPAVLAALLLAVYPLGPEAVTNVAGRADLLEALVLRPGDADASGRLAGILERLDPGSVRQTGPGRWEIDGGAAAVVALRCRAATELAAVFAAAALPQVAGRLRVLASDTCPTAVPLGHPGPRPYPPDRGNA